MFGKRKYQKRDLYPDEIFLDSTNLPKFNIHQFEGRIEKPISKKSAYGTLIFFIALSSVFFLKAFSLQVVNGEDYFNISQNNRLNLTPLFANRGLIYDRNEVPLAWNVIGEEQTDYTLRKYTDMDGFAHVLGYLNYPAKDNNDVYYRPEFIGRDGVEKSFNEELSGRNGVKITEINALQKIQSESVQRPPEDGQNLYLSIDSRIQEKLFNTIKNTAENVNFRGGAGVIMNVKTGEIIALTSYPEYDPQVMTDGDDSAEIKRELDDPREPFLNRAVSGLYTPGSVVKPFMAMAALTENIITPEKKILSTGSLRVENPYFPGRYTLFNDWKAHGWVDMRRAIAVSSNVYFFEIGGGYKDQPGLGIYNIGKYMRRFGISEKTGIDLPGENEGIIPSPEWKEQNFEDGTWRIGDTYNTSIGQYGFQTNPIQMARALAGIANEGYTPRPTLRKGGNNDLTEIGLDKEDYKVVKEGMRLGALEGSASGLSVPYVKVAAKTGTAELGSTKSYVNSWVMGFFPYEEPEYVFVVVMERGPRSNLIGGVSVMRQLLDFMRWNTPEYFGFEPLPKIDDLPEDPVTPPVTPPINPPSPPVSQPDETEPAPVEENPVQDPVQQNPYYNPYQNPYQTPPPSQTDESPGGGGTEVVPNTF